MKGYKNVNTTDNFIMLHILNHLFFVSRLDYSLISFRYLVSQVFFCNQVCLQTHHSQVQLPHSTGFSKDQFSFNVFTSFSWLFLNAMSSGHHSPPTSFTWRNSPTLPYQLLFMPQYESTLREKRNCTGTQREELIFIYLELYK